MAKSLQSYNSSMIDEHAFAMNARPSYDRRSGVERRTFTYSWHIPERRSGADQRKCAETM